MLINKIRQSLILICFILTIFSFFGNRPALAQTGQPSPWLNVVIDNGLRQTGKTAYDTPDKAKDPRLIVVQIIQVVLGLLGIIFVILMIMGGFIWMTASGNEEKIDKAKKTLYSAAIGLLIILACLAITRYISNRIIYVTTNDMPTIHLGGDE